MHFLRSKYDLTAEKVMLKRNPRYELLKDGTNWDLDKMTKMLSLRMQYFICAARGRMGYFESGSDMEPVGLVFSSILWIPPVKCLVSSGGNLPILKEN